MKTIKTPNSAHIIEKIIAEIRTINCAAAEVSEKILQDELNEYCRMLEAYYEEEYCIGISNARTKAYDEGYASGHSDGCDDGYENGYADCHAKNNYPV